MTGTALTEAKEFWDIYKMNVVAIPTNRELQRKEHTDVIYLEEKHKFKAVADEVEALNKYDTIEYYNGDLYSGTIESENENSVVLLPSDSRKRETIDQSDIAQIHRAGRPVLIGTVSIERVRQFQNFSHNECEARNSEREKPWARSRDYCSGRSTRGCYHCHQHGWSWYRYRAWR